MKNVIKPGMYIEYKLEGSNKVGRGIVMSEDYDEGSYIVAVVSGQHEFAPYSEIPFNHTLICEYIGDVAKQVKL